MHIGCDNCERPATKRITWKSNRMQAPAFYYECSACAAQTALDLQRVGSTVKVSAL